MSKDQKTGKKYIQSGVVIACYVIAALLLVYTCYQAGSTVKQINEYYGSYGMKAKPFEYFTYILQAIIQPILNAFIVFMAGFTLTAVRKLNPENYKSAEELLDAKEAKTVARDNKQAAKGEAKAAKAKAKDAADKDSVRIDFTESLEAEMKSDSKGTGAKAAPAKKNTSSKRSSSGSKSSGASKSGSKSSSSKSTSSAKKTGSAKSTAKKTTSNAKKKATDEVKNEAKKATEEVKSTVEVKTSDNDNNN